MSAAIATHIFVHSIHSVNRGVIVISPPPRTTRTHHLHIREEEHTVIVLVEHLPHRKNISTIAATIVLLHLLDKHENTVKTIVMATLGVVAKLDELRAGVGKIDGGSVASTDLFDSHVAAARDTVFHRPRHVKNNKRGSVKTRHVFDRLTESLIKSEASIDLSNL